MDGTWKIREHTRGYEKAEVELRPVPERHSWLGLELGLGAVRVRVPCRRGTPVGGKRMAVRVRG